MTEKNWEAIKIQYCHHADEEVGLEGELVYPPERLSEVPEIKDLDELFTIKAKSER